ncbi:hypothetical protein NDU88_008786 [Pleurodeles waltl]|uniref:Uncharacterized protein n=1 Tax=Pleurodeles waltl TaxID=8319 RepID=A0AAV7P093_PLEWA|nr:hypothetical protein NDU88_008786 [Pleurodeles waltl]
MWVGTAGWALPQCVAGPVLTLAPRSTTVPAIPLRMADLEELLAHVSHYEVIKAHDVVPPSDAYPVPSTTSQLPAEALIFLVQTDPKPKEAAPQCIDCRGEENGILARHYNDGASFLDLRNTSGLETLPETAGPFTGQLRY